MDNLVNCIQSSPYGITYCLLILAFAVVLLVIGGECLVRGAIGIAKDFGTDTLIVGLTIVAFSTSSPELAFNVFAAAGGHGEISIGNIFGSNIANLALVLGLAAVIHNHVRRKKQNSDNPKPESMYKPGFVYKEGYWLLGSTFGIVILTLLAFFLQDTNQLLGFSWPCGVVLLVAFFWFFKDVVVKGAKKESGEQNKLQDPNKISLPMCFLLLVVGLLFLGVGGKAAEISAVTAARIAGISDIYIGVTIIALATSLPEVVTSVIAIRKDAPGIAMGNIVGSCLFNVLLVLPITMCVPLIMGGESVGIQIPGGSEVWIYAVSMLVITIITWNMLRTKPHVIDPEGGHVTDKEGYSLLGIYVAFIVGVTIWQAVG